jgi:hypothetical protein
MAADGLKNGLARFLLFGAAGWALENWLFPGDNGGAGRYSKLFGGRKIPFLPVYGLGGLMLGPAASRRKTTAGRFVTYAVAFTGVELIAGALDRMPGNGAPSWDYDGNEVDVFHAAAWGALGLATEGILKRVDPLMLSGLVAKTGLSLTKF